MGMPKRGSRLPAPTRAEMAEWPNAPVLKTGGSNPSGVRISLSAYLRVADVLAGRGLALECSGKLL